eukprot:RCo032908
MLRENALEPAPVMLLQHGSRKSIRYSFLRFSLTFFAIGFFRRSRTLNFITAAGTMFAFLLAFFTCRSRCFFLLGRSFTLFAAFTFPLNITEQFLIFLRIFTSEHQRIFNQHQIDLAIIQIYTDNPHPHLIAQAINTAKILANQRLTGWVKLIVIISQR